MGVLRPPMSALLSLVAMTVIACGRAPFEGDWTLPELEDLNPAEGVVEVELRASAARWEYVEGERTDVLAYNGRAPGPVLRATRGDRVIVHFRNDLDVPTTIHWHGLRVPADMDGTEIVQSAIEPGASFTYDFIVPDALLGWFHPHVDSAVQVERGLQAPVLIDDANDPLPAGRVMVLDDVMLPGLLGPRSVLVVNGHELPVLSAAAGTQERWRMVNTSNTRAFHLTLPGAAFQLVGVDGGALASARAVDTLHLWPGERVDVVVTLPRDRGEVELRTTGVHGMMGFASEEPVLWVRTTDADRNALTVPDPLAVIAGLPPPDTERRLVLDGGMMQGGGHRGMGGGMMGSGGYSIDGERWPDVTPLKAHLGDVEEWSIVNRSAVDHPFHLHGMRFHVDGARAWKDTVNVPNGASVRIRFLADNPGRWMFHCHILAHAEQGMMGELDVE